MQVAPSIMTCDFSKLAEEIKFVENSGADMLHLDVMDGVFVPNLSIGPAVVSCIRPLTSMPFDVHLMMQYPHRYIDTFADSGADLINFHIESSSPIKETLEHIKSLNKIAGLTIKPATPAKDVYPYLDMLGLVLIMTVEPGFGGQKFMQDMMPKVTELRREIDRRQLDVKIQVDGGINAQTAAVAADAGADIAVVGNALFTADNSRELVSRIQQL